MLRGSAQGRRGGNYTVPSCSGASPEHHRVQVPKALGTAQQVDLFPAERRGGQAPSWPRAEAVQKQLRRSRRSPLFSPRRPGLGAPSAGAAAPARSRCPGGARSAPGSPGALGPAEPSRLCLAGGQNKAETGKGKRGESTAPAASQPSAWISLRETALQADPDRGQGVERGGGGGRIEGGREKGREGRRDEREPLSFPGLFFQFPVSHCAHSGYVLRLQVCPLLAAFPRLPSVGSGCRGSAAADRDRHVMIISLGALSLSSRSLLPPLSIPPSPPLSSFLSEVAAAAAAFALTPAAVAAAAGPAGSMGGRRGLP